MKHLFIDTWKKTIVPLIISVFVSLVAMGLFFSKSFDFIEWMLIDKAYRLKPARVSQTPIVMIEIDKESLLEIGQWPWPRDIHAKLVADLATFGAKYVAFDIFFATESAGTTSMQDFIFAQACSLAGNTYFSLNFDISQSSNTDESQPQGQPVLERFAYPLTPSPWLNLYSGQPLQLVNSLYKHTAGSGHIALKEDDDGKIRRVPLWLEYNGKYYPQLALRLFIDQFKTSNIDFPRKGYMRITADKHNIMVPVDDKSQYFINWCGQFGESFYYCSYIDILRAFQDYTRGEKPLVPVRRADKLNMENALDFFKDKICFVGYTTAGLVDQKPVAISNRYPLVGIHANVFENLSARNFYRPIPWLLECLMICFFTLLMIIFILKLSIPRVILAVTGLVIAVLILTQTAFMKYTIWIYSSYINFSMISCFIGGLIYRMATEKKKSREIKRIFKRYVAPEVVDTILNDPEAVALGGKRRIVTVMFCDIRNFTSLAESLPPEEVIQLLNSFFSLAVKIIFKYRGTVDKFIGDCVMAYWGAPTPMENHAAAAVNTALEIQEELKRFNESNHARDYHKIQVGIGISSGEVVAGNIGLADKKFQKTEYTVIGDYVNLASRLVDLAPPNEILISEHTYSILKDTINAQLLPAVTIKGKRDPIQIYKILFIKP